MSSAKSLESSAAYFTNILMNVSIEANRVDKDRTAPPTGAVCCGSTLFERQTGWTKIGLLLQEQSALGPHCLTKMLLKHFRR